MCPSDVNREEKGKTASGYQSQFVIAFTLNQEVGDGIWQHGINSNDISSLSPYLLSLSHFDLLWTSPTSTLSSPSLSLYTALRVTFSIHLFPHPLTFIAFFLTLLSFPIFHIISYSFPFTSPLHFNAFNHSFPIFIFPPLPLSFHFPSSAAKSTTSCHHHQYSTRSNKPSNAWGKMPNRHWQIYTCLKSRQEKKSI